MRRPPACGPRAARPLVLARAALLACAALAGCAAGLPPPDEPEPPPFEFRLGPGDRLAVTVWGEDRLSHEVEVGPDGSTAHPLVGDVKLVGLTLDEARVELAQRIRAVVVDPVVSLRLVDTRSHVVHVAGEVARPGPVHFVRGATALGAVQAAGGYRGATADLGSVRVVRARMGERVTYEVDLEGVLAGTARDLWLRPGDVVWVPPRTVTRWDRWARQALPWTEPVDEGCPR